MLLFFLVYLFFGSQNYCFKLYFLCSVIDDFETNGSNEEVKSVQVIESNLSPTEEPNIYFPPVVSPSHK